MAIRILFSS